MSNDIHKYRLWDKTEKVFIDNFVIYPDGTFAIFDFRFHEYTNPLSEDDGYVLDRCIGMTDKNGKLIYEVDVVRFLWQLKGSEVCKIVWDKIHCSFDCIVIKTGVDFITWYSVFENWQGNRCEVIGNIHEMEVTE